MVYPLSRIFPLLLFCAGLLVAGCGEATSEAKANQGAAGPPPVSVAPVTKRVVQEFDEFSARLEAVESVDIRARVAGTLDKVHFREGQKVKKGEILFTIDPRPFAMEAPASRRGSPPPVPSGGSPKAIWGARKNCCPCKPFRCKKSINSAPPCAMERPPFKRREPS